MGLFTKKKEEKSLTLPEFPKLPEFPSYESVLNEEKQEQRPIQGPPRFERPSEKEDLGFDLPVREGNLPKLRTATLSREPVVEEKPLFIKMDDYKSAINDLAIIKAKITDAEKILEKLKGIREQEEKEFMDWHEGISRIKDKLISIDEKLFEQ